MTQTLPRTDPVTRQLYATLAALRSALTDQSALAVVDYAPESPDLWTPSLRLDASAGGLWDRTLCTGGVPGDGLMAHLLLRVAGRLSVELHGRAKEDLLTAQVLGAAAILPPEAC